MTEDVTPGALVPVGREITDLDMSRLAEELVASAAGQGVQLTGEGGLLTLLTQRVLQTALEAEMAHHLGYDKHDRAGRAARTSATGRVRRRSRPRLGILIDAIVLKVREGQVANRPVYVAIGINLEGYRDVLGLWMGPSGGEGAKQWLIMHSGACQVFCVSDRLVVDGFSIRGRG